MFSNTNGVKGFLLFEINVSNMKRVKKPINKIRKKLMKTENSG
jgi:hypothetical protein